MFADLLVDIPNTSPFFLLELLIPYLEDFHRKSTPFWKFLFVVDRYLSEKQQHETGLISAANTKLLPTKHE